MADAARSEAFCFENGWDGSPYRTSGNRSDNRNQNDRYIRHIAAKLDHHDEADQSADGDLAVSTKVPEFHFESWDESRMTLKLKRRPKPQSAARLPGKLSMLKRPSGFSEEPLLIVQILPTSVKMAPERML